MHIAPTIRHSTFCIRHFLPALLLAPCALLASPPPELTLLRQHYDKVVAEKVTAPFDGALGTLNTKFTAALNNAAADARKSGSLPAVLAIEADKKRITDKFPLPDADDEQTPDALKKLRTIYREQFKKLDEQRAAEHNAILPGYTAKLQGLETTLTKADRVDEAQEVMVYREGLAVSAPLIATAPSGTTEKPPGTATTTRSSPGRKFPPGDDRKAAEWALDMNAEALDIRVGEKVSRVNERAKLPAEPFQIVGIRFNHQTPPKQPYKGMDVLAGLQGVEWLGLVNMHITDDDTDILASMPKLNSISLDQTRERFTGERLALLAALPGLTKLSLLGCGAVNSKGAKGIGSLAALTSLNLKGADLGDKDMEHIARLTNLITLDLGLTHTTSKGIAMLKALTNLKTFGWTPTPKKAPNELREIALALSQITGFYLATKVPLSEEDAAGLSAFTQMTSVFLEHESATTAVLAGLARLPALDYLRIYSAEKLTDEAFVALAKSPSLGVLEFDHAPMITGACLADIAKITKLRKLTLSRCSKINEAAIDAFKQARPDVSVSK